MSSAETFNPNDYWLERGKTYWEEDRLQSESFRLQEAFIAKTVMDLNPKSVLEVGCGFGRVTRVLADAMPEAKLLGLDLSPDQIFKAVELTTHSNVEYRLWDLCSEIALPQADVAVAVEVLLHHPPQVLEAIVGRILKACPVLIHEFYDADVPGQPLSFHCWAHDYWRIHRSLGADCKEVRWGGHSLMVVSRA